MAGQDATRGVGIPSADSVATVAPPCLDPALVLAWGAGWRQDPEGKESWMGQHRRSGIQAPMALFIGISAASCGYSLTRSFVNPLLDPNEPRTDNPAVALSAAGVSPSVLHVNSPATVKFTNDDKVPHTIEPAPELGYGTCPEVAQVGTLGAGKSTSVTLSESLFICAYQDASAPTNPAFQGLIVLH